MKEFTNKNNKQIKILDPYKEIKQTIDIIENQQIKPWELLENPNKYEIPSKILDVGVLNENFLIFINEKQSDNSINNIQSLVYNELGRYQKTYHLNFDDIDDRIYDFKYAGQKGKNLYLLIKWKEKGWCIHHVSLNNN
jgi:hypothetical protein